jgi:ABC-type Mn2+/Zn2+ transport system ATPase subunit
MNHDPLVRLDGVSIGYGQKVVLADLQFNLPRGSFTALLGANGSGKSTLVKTLAGLQPLLAGQLRVATPSDTRAIIGYVPQREQLDPLFLFSGFEVALMGAFGRVLPGRPVPATERDDVRHCLRLTGADGFAHQSYSQLSGGQKQRVLIARALAMKPDLLLLDEPTAGIDLATAQAIMDVLARLNREQNQTILWVSHDLPTVREYAQQVIWLHHGRLLQGPVQELTTPAKTAELLGLSLG